ncbi:helix-turn-helix domain-containing protein, partial [Vibrio parahaemolyticus]
REELERRQKSDKHYSLRTFAKFLQISPSSLSHVLNKKRDLSKKMLVQILD